MKNCILTILMFGVAFTQWGCASMSSLQTAESLKPDKSQVAIGAGTYTSKSFTTSLNGNSRDADISVPNFEVSYRRGIIDKVEAGAKLALPGTIIVDGKYQFIDGEVFDMAAGFGLGYLSLETGSDPNKVKTTIVDVMVPLYLSAKVNEYFTPYLSPRYLLRNVSSTSASGSASVMGATGGLKIGKTWGLYAEYGMQKGMGNDFTANQVNFAIFWE